MSSGYWLWKLCESGLRWTWWRSETKRSLKRRTALQWTRRHPSRHLNIHLQSIMQATVHTALISIHFLFSRRLVFWSFLSVGGWKTRKTTFCHAMTKNTRCKLYIFISVRDDMVFVNILFIVGFMANRIHCKNRCKLIQPITSLHPQFWRPLLDFHLKVYRY